jgi:hypothetical protein
MELFSIGGERLHSTEPAGRGNYGNQIARLHLVVHKVTQRQPRMVNTFEGHSQVIHQQRDAAANLGAV